MPILSTPKAPQIKTKSNMEIINTSVLIVVLIILVTQLTDLLELGKTGNFLINTGLVATCLLLPGFDFKSRLSVIAFVALGLALFHSIVLGAL